MLHVFFVFFYLHEVYWYRMCLYVRLPLFSGFICFLVFLFPLSALVFPLRLGGVGRTYQVYDVKNLLVGTCVAARKKYLKKSRNFLFVLFLETFLKMLKAYIKKYW